MVAHPTRCPLRLTGVRPPLGPPPLPVHLARHVATVAAVHLHHRLAARLGAQRVDLPAQEAAGSNAAVLAVRLRPYCISALVVVRVPVRAASRAKGRSRSRATSSTAPPDRHLQAAIQTGSGC